MSDSTVKQTLMVRKFAFHGDELDVNPSDGTVHVSIRRVCEHLGVSFPRQLKKLKSDPAIGVAMKATPSPGGEQLTACVDLRALPLWLATIHPSKVKPAVREKLIAYKREASEVLANHFLGARQKEASSAMLATPMPQEPHLHDREP